MTCYVLDTDHLSLYERCRPQVCERILRARQNSGDTLLRNSMREDWLKFGKRVRLKR